MGDEKLPLKQCFEKVNSSISIAELFYCKKTILLTISFALKLFHDRVLFRNKYTFLNFTDHPDQRFWFLGGQAIMALGAGLSSDFLFPKWKFTSLFCINLIVLIIEIPLLSFGFFHPWDSYENVNNLEMFILGALTDGYYYMFFMMGSLSIAWTAYVCEWKCILGTVLGFVFGVATILNFVIFEEILTYFEATNTVYSLMAVSILSLSTICLLHMVYQEIKYNMLVCE